MTHVGFVGLGNIGRPMAQRLATAGDPAIDDVVVFDVVPEAVAALEADGAVAAASVTELAARVEVVCVMVRDDAQVRAVLDDVLAAGRPLTVVVHSTVAPETPAALAEHAAPHGVLVVDAPVSGGAMGATDGRLAIMVGGDETAFAAARPVLDVLGGKVLHAGPIGAGTRFKLARNLMHFVAFTAATEAQRLAEATGIDLRALGDVVRYTDAITGGPGAIMHRETAAPIAPDDFWFPIMDAVRILGEKDLGYAVDLAHEHGVEVPLAELALRRLGSGLGVGG